MDTIPGMNDTMIIALIVIALLAGALIFAILFTLRRGPLDTEIGDEKHHGEYRALFDKNSDLKHFTVTRRERTAWFAGTLAAIALIGLTSWMAQRDEAARYADAAPAALGSSVPDRNRDPLERLVAATRCRAPNYPLEQFVIALGSEADKGRPAISCVYITADLGVRPRLSYERPLLATTAAPE